MVTLSVSSNWYVVLTQQFHKRNCQYGSILHTAGLKARSVYLDSDCMNLGLVKRVDLNLNSNDPELTLNVKLIAFHTAGCGRLLSPMFNDAFKKPDLGGIAFLKAADFVCLLNYSTGSKREQLDLFYV